MCQHIYSVHAFTKPLYIGVSNRDKFHSNMGKCAEERVHKKSRWWKNTSDIKQTTLNPRSCSLLNSLHLKINFNFLWQHARVDSSIFLISLHQSQFPNLNIQSKLNCESETSSKRGMMMQQESGEQDKSVSAWFVWSCF